MVIVDIGHANTTVTLICCLFGERAVDEQNRSPVIETNLSLSARVDSHHSRPPWDETDELSHRNGHSHPPRYYLAGHYKYIVYVLSSFV
jgi:hypothetical protein